MSEERWYTAAGEPNVEGRFDYYDLIDGPASREADEIRTRKVIVLYVRVRGSSPGGPDKVSPETQARFVKRFPDAWKAFQGEVPRLEGTLLEEMPGMDPETRQRFQFSGVMTIEQLAALSDMQAQKIQFGTRKLRDAAIKLLSDRREAASLQMVQDHQGRKAEPAKRRGRPPKVAPTAAA